MPFHATSFFLFFPLALTVYSFTPSARKWLVLLLVSYLYYALWSPWYLLSLVYVSALSYAAGRSCDGMKKSIYKKIFLFVMVVLLLIPLLLSRYTAVRSAYSFLIPVGISFYTFQSLSYLFDVYRKKIKPEKQIGLYFLFLSFFPSVTAGPISRWSQFRTEVKQKRSPSYPMLTSGIKRFTWGLFKKIVIADTIALSINPIFDRPGAVSGISLVVAVILYSVQIYCDFSGYSDMALGVARMLGIHLQENFRFPYFSRSIIDFWQRWHISLTSWLREYLYIPFGGRRNGALRMVLATGITFILSGLWHGVHWTFVCWGVFHALAIMCTRYLGKYDLRIGGILSVVLTFILVSIGWIFFRAQRMTDVFLIFKNIAGGGVHPFFLTTYQSIFLLISVIFLFSVEYIHRNTSLENIFSNKSVLFRWSFYYLLLFFIIEFGVYKRSPFIYFGF